MLIVARERLRLFFQTRTVESRATRALAAVVLALVISLIH
jgi:hypothetical protein